MSGLLPIFCLKAMKRDKSDAHSIEGYQDLEPNEGPVPERNLLRAVLLNAIADLKRPGAFSRKATDFFLSSEKDYLFSFRSICDFLSIEPKKVLYVVGLTDPNGNRLEPELKTGVQLEEVTQEPQKQPDL